MIKVAVCFSGEPRSIQWTQQRLRKVFDDSFVDYQIFAYIPECESSMLLEKYFPEANIIIKKDEYIDDSNAPSDNEIRTGTQCYLQQINGLKESNLMRKHYEKVNQVNFDFIVRCRMDVLFKTDLPKISRLKKGVIYIPDYHHWNGYHDRFCIASRDVIDSYMNIIDVYHEDPTKCHHPESFMKMCLDRSRVRIKFMQNVGFNRIRASGIELDDYRPPVGILKPLVRSVLPYNLRVIIGNGIRFLSFNTLLK